MEINFEFLYYTYLILIGLHFIFSFLVIYHLVRFGHFGIGSFVMTGVYVFVVFIILATSYQYITQIDWSQTIQITSALQ